ncbi:MAG: cyclic nucleotide-binding domain-containing protein [Rhodocyclaceae bacterium]|nr:cyclic nucleotide-binding domain-containing protein [Rhodocyclaceae bacterium]
MNALPANLEVLSRLQPLSQLDEKNLRGLLPLCRYDKFNRNQNPLRESDWSGRVMYLTKGQLRVDAADGGMDILVGGYEKALSPIVSDGHTPAGSKALTDIEVLSLEEEPLDILVTWDQVAQKSGHSSDQNTSTTEWRRMSGLFTMENLTLGALSALPAANIDMLLQQFESIAVRRDEVIIQQGDLGDYYFLIERGRCKVSRQVAGTSVELAELKEGDVFGEEALLADSVRNATVTMKTDGALLRLAKDAFLKMLREPLMKRIDFAAAKQKIADGAIWVDVRFPAEFQTNGLPNAINIPLNDIRQVTSVLDNKRTYVVYCQTGRRSAAAAFLLSQRGINALLLDGGLKAISDKRELEI